MLICHLIYSKYLEENVLIIRLFLIVLIHLVISTTRVHHTLRPDISFYYHFANLFFFHKYFKRLFIPDLSLRDLDTNISFP